MDISEFAKCVVGQNYEIIYMIPGVHKKPRITIMTFMEMDPDNASGDLFFSLRPKAGTQQIHSSWIYRIEPTDKPVEFARMKRGLII